MKINIPKETKKYFKLTQELIDLFNEGYCFESDYPDMIEICQRLYDHVLYEFGLLQYDCGIECQYSLEELEAKVKECRKLKGIKGNKNA